MILFKKDTAANTGRVVQSSMLDPLPLMEENVWDKRGGPVGAFSLGDNNLICKDFC